MTAVRQQYRLSKPVYAKRAEAVSKIPHFWPLVFEQAPLEIDQFVQPQDSRILAESLTGFTVTRPELEGDAADSGNPRSLKFRFEFAPNDDFEDTVLEKSVWYRRASDGWTGLVSDPVKIRWKEGRDLTKGLTDMSLALWEARKKTGDMKATGLPEYTELKKKVDHWNAMNTSFFSWFGWVSSRRWVSEEESAKANADFAAIRSKRQAGEKAEIPEPTDEELAAQDDSDVEVHAAGDELAISLAEDLWPGAIKLFTDAQEADQLSDAEFEDGDLEDLDDDEEDGEPIDIRSLVQDNGGSRRESGGRPAKRQKQ